mmetsp:Transcript_33241/g.38168  ORF Transcript_33241/g.38168 Transcript_33241/m.38168 type:complete len:88 (+) Transcript_33241:203-466(+)
MQDQNNYVFTRPDPFVRNFGTVKAKEAELSQEKQKDSSRIFSYKDSEEFDIEEFIRKEFEKYAIPNSKQKQGRGRPEKKTRVTRKTI